MDLVKLIEDSPEPKKTQLINMVRNEDPDFAARVEAKILSWDKIKALPEGAVAEVIGATPAKFVAISLIGESAEFITLAEKCLGKAYNDYKQEKETFSSAPPNAGQIEAARRKLLAEARKLEAEGRIKLGASEPTAAPSSSAGSNSASSQKLAPISSILGGPSATPGLARAEDGCPPLDTFRFEAPPPGLSGERLETHLKSMLGF